MSNAIIATLTIICAVMYLMRRRSRLRADE
jgi:hypothetical protein